MEFNWIWQRGAGIRPVILLTEGKLELLGTTTFTSFPTTSFLLHSQFRCATVFSGTFCPSLTTHTDAGGVCDQPAAQLSCFRQTLTVRTQPEVESSVPL